MGLQAVTGRLRADDLLRHGAILAGAAVVNGGLNYAFQVFMGRALRPEAYGVFGAVFALFYVTSILTRGIKFSAIRFTAATGESNHDRATLHGGLLLRSLAVGTVAFLALGALSPLVADFLGVATVWPVVLVAVTVPFEFAFRGNVGSLQGFQWFTAQGAYRVLYAGTKLALGVALVWVGYGLVGAFTALAVAAALGVVATTWHLRRRLEDWSFEWRARGFDYGTVYRYFSPAVLAGFCLTVPANVDVIVVSHHFAGEAVGLYVAASVLGKVLIFLPMGISNAMFPKVTSDRTRDGSDRTDALLNRALAYAAIVAGSGALAFWLVPRLILTVFFGAAYADAAPLLRWYGVAVLFFVLSIVVLNALLASDRMRFVYAFAAVSVVEIGLMWTVAATMVGIIQVILVTNAALFAFGLYEAKL